MECSETNTEARVPLMAAIRAHPGSLLLIIGLRLSELVGFYVVILFALSYATENLGISNSTMLAGNIIVAALAFLSLPTFYVLSDRIGRRPVFIAGAVLGVVLAFHYCWALDTGSVMISVASILLTNGCHDLVVSIQQPFFTEMLGTEQRRDDQLTKMRETCSKIFQDNLFSFQGVARTLGPAEAARGVEV